MSTVKLYIYNDASKMGNGVGFAESAILPFTEIKTYEYTSDPDPTTGQTTTVKMTNEMDVRVYVDLLKVDFMKKMYRPGVIKVALLVTGLAMDHTSVKKEVWDKNGKLVETETDTADGDSTSGDAPNTKTTNSAQHAKGIYRDKYISRENIKSLFTNAKVKLEIDSNSVASNYFVYSVHSTHRKNSRSSIPVDLIIYSEDKLLTLEKYSKAYTAKRLGTDIFKNEINNFNLSGTNTVDLNFLSYNDGASEFRLPYLIQYNESFYDFLKRTANRCGEFLYHEDGKLHLGVSLTRLDKDKFNDKGEVTEKAIDYALVAHECYYEGLYDMTGLKDDIIVENYNYNYINNTERDSSHFATAGKLHYSDPLANDEYLDLIEKNYSTWVNEQSYPKDILAHLIKLLSGTSLSKIVSNFFTLLAERNIELAVENTRKNDEHEEENIKPWEGDDCKDQWNSSNQLNQFGTADSQTSALSDSTVNMNASFYSLVRQAERKVGEEALFMDFGEDYQNLKLGDVIKVEKKPYLVIQIDGSYEYKDPETISQQKVVAIPLYEATDNNLVAMPPALPKVCIRESQPQLAFVTHNIDPKKIGRVRLRFAWQEKDDDASPWVRVALPFATDGGGVKFMPEVDDEVLVSFEEGNVERPYVSGFLLSERSNQSWCYMPERAIYSGNGQGITFDDVPNSRTFFTNMIPAIGFVNSLIPESRTLIPELSEGNKHLSSLAGGMKIRDQYGLYEISMSSDSRSVTIQSSLGTVEVNAFTGITISAPNGDIKIEGKNVEIAASNNLKLSSGSVLKDRFIPDSSNSGNKGYDFINIMGKTVLDTGKTLIGGFLDELLDLSLFRTLLEVALRPIDGTTSIKSYTFVQIEAGKGSVEIPSNQLRSPDISTTFKDIRDMLDAIPATIFTKFDNFNNALKTLQSTIQSYKETSAKIDGKTIMCSSVISFASINGKGWKATADQLTEKDNAFNWDAALKDVTFNKDEALNKVKNAMSTFTNGVVEDMPNVNAECYTNNTRNHSTDLAQWKDYYSKYYTNEEAKINNSNKDKKDGRDKFVGCADELAKALSNVFNAFDSVNNIQTLVSPTTYGGTYKDKAIASIKNYQDFVKQANSDLFDKLVNNSIDEKTDMSKLLDNDVKKLWSRKAVHDFMKEIYADVNKEFSDSIVMANPSTLAPANFMDDLQWRTAVDSWFPEVQLSWDRDLFEHLKNTTYRSVKEWAIDDVFHPWKTIAFSAAGKHRWQTGVQGKILLSDTPGTTISFEKDGSTYKQVNAIASSKYIYDLRDFIKAL
jgi:L-rhamnose mutarotase